MSETNDKHKINVSGKLVDRIDSQIGEHRGVIVFGFYFTAVMAALSIILLFNRGFENMESGWIFSIGGDIFCLLVCTMLYLSCLLGRERDGAYLRIFTLLLTINGMALFLDELCWLVQSVPEYRVAGLIINVLYYANGAILIYMFWRYITYALNIEGKLMLAIDTLLGVLLLPELISCFVNLFYPLYFTIDENGTYERGQYYIFSQIYLLLTIAAVILALVLSKASKRQKYVAGSFVSIPIASYIITSNVFGLTVQYSSTLVAIVLIFGVIFADRANTIALTERDLTLATRIQADMLPNIFPAFPEREEFDIYASMNPAKEVGGDFYDFFFIDDTHLGLVMADVSGKGVPAALFMMIAMTLIKNNAMTGKSPAEVLSATNEQICANNREEMFVTVWFGILDLETGKITAANAGHEFPMVKSTDGDFELLKDHHGFVIGGMEGMKYKEYEIQMNPGSKLFLYTDGVPEATNSNDELFGVERALDALNIDSNRSPMELLQAVDGAVDVFVGDAPQFDDLTMLCIKYNGPTA